MACHHLLTALLAAALFNACTESHDAHDGAAPDPADYTACDVPSDCTVAPASCCGSCGTPTRGDAVAIATDRAAAYRNAVCGANTGCPACAPLFIDPTLVATCEERRCTLVDLHEHESTACSTAADCRVRTPDCCQCDGDTSLGRLLGVSSERAYASLVCDPEQTCPECEPVYPTEVTVRCNADNHCETRDTRLPGED